LNSRLGFIHDDFEWSDGWLSPPTTIISFFVILSMLLIAWKSRNKLPIVSFGIFFYFSGHLMESTVVPLEMVFEHRNYLPSYGIILVFTGLLYQYVNSSYTRAGIILLLASTLSFQTKIRADIWSSTSTLYEYMIKVKPGSARLAAVKARILEDSGLYDDAINVLSAHINKGSVLQRMSIECSKSGYITDKKLRLATEAFNGPVDMYAISEVIKLANLGLERRCRFSEQNFIGLLEKMLDLPIASDFEIQRLLVYKAHYLWKMHEYSAAFKSLEEAAEIPVYDPIPYLLAAEWSVNKGNIVQARKYYESAKLISENSNKSYDQVFRAVEKLITEHDKPE
jgi:tetratricopeptide (TPR) repeat protein